jgi:hypothetical protein
MLYHFYIGHKKYRFSRECTNAHTLLTCTCNFFLGLLWQWKICFLGGGSTGAELNFRFGCVYFLKFDFIKTFMVGSPWWWCCHLPSVRCMPGWKPRKVDRVVDWGHRRGYLPHIWVLDLKPWPFRLSMMMVYHVATFSGHHRGVLVPLGLISVLLVTKSGLLSYICDSFYHSSSLLSARRINTRFHGP